MAVHVTQKFAAPHNLAIFTWVIFTEPFAMLKDVKKFFCEHCSLGAIKIFVVHKHIFE
jgi:hypothetical protein